MHSSFFKKTPKPREYPLVSSCQEINISTLHEYIQVKQQLPGKQEKLYKTVYKTRVAIGMWELNDHISAALTMHPTEVLI